MSPPSKRPLLFFHASCGVSHLQAPPPTPSSVDPKAGIKGSSLELLCPSAFSDLETLLCIPFGTSKKCCPTPWKCHPQGLATLSVDSVPKSTEASFSSPRSWASPLEALLFHSDRFNVSIESFRSCTFVQNLFGLEPVLQRLDPAMKAVPLFASGWIRSGWGPGFPRALDLSGFLSEANPQKASLFSGNPPKVDLSRSSRIG